METNVLVHQNAIDIISRKPRNPRCQRKGIGADIERFGIPATIEWKVPSLTYTNEVTIHWDNAPLVVSHKPGAHIAGSWLRYDAENVVFVGDSVILDQPPFLAWSDLDCWLKELAYLESDFFKDYQIIAGREGVVNSGSINRLVEFLNRVKIEVKSLLLQENWRDDLNAVVSILMQYFVFDYQLDALYRNRLNWGLKQYIKNHCPVE